MVTHNQHRKLFLILDNARYHHAKIVTEWVQANQDRIELHFLPPYSPNLNAAEHVWRMAKRLATHNCHFATLDALREKVKRRFLRFKGNPATLRGAIRRFLPKGYCKTKGG